MTGEACFLYSWAQGGGASSRHAAFSRGACAQPHSINDEAGYLIGHKRVRSLNVVRSALQFTSSL